MHNFTRISLLTVAILIALSSAFPAAAQQPVIGARPLGMGEAFLAIADDGNALSWNPAGLPSLGHHEIVSSYADLFGIGIKNSTIGYVFPAADTYTFGFDWAHLGFEDPELGYKKDSFRLSYGHKVWKEISVGWGLRYITTDMILDSNSLGKASGWGLDLSLLCAPFEKLKVGMVVRDATDTKVEYEDGGSEVIAPRSFRFGMAYRPMEALIVALDVDDQLHVGGEYWLYNMLGLRGGVQKDLHTSEPMTLSGGTSIRYKLFQFDYAYVRPPTLPSSHRFSLSLFFNLYPSMVRIAEVEIENLFPAFHKRYAAHPLGRVKLVNRDDKPHQTTVSFYIPKLMDAPTERQVIVRPKETKEVEVNGVFSRAVTELTEDIMTQAEVKVSYATAQRTRSDRKSAGLFVYNRNATTWDDLKKEAAFITSTDPIIAEFARPTLVAHEEEIKELGRASRNVMRAMVLFNAVSQHGVRYIADPNNPYSRMSADKSAVDNIQYPAEVLRKKSGDCDDLTALYCALLENVGISTALVDAPGHIYMMFDSGVPIEQARRFPIAESLYVVRNGQLWIPVEITLFGTSFLEAWRSGAGECVSLSEQDRLRVMDTSEGWEAYELAQVYVAIRECDHAISEYRRLLELGADPAQVYNNMGIAYFLKAEVREAAQSFKRAMDLDPEDEGIKGNFELTMSTLGKEKRIALAREIGVSVSEETKAVEFDVDEESFYWRE